MNLLHLFSTLSLILNGAHAWFNVKPPSSTSPASPSSSQRKSFNSGRYKKKTSTTPPTPPPPPRQNFPEVPDAIGDTLEDFNPISPGVWNSMTSAAISFVSKLAPQEIRQRTDRAARIEVNRLPPTSFKIDLSDVPLIGKALTGTYAKVKDESKIKNPSVVIASPRDKFGAVSDAVERGNLDFRLGGMVNSGLDVRLEPNKAGEAPVRIQSPLIPKWPFANRKSDWYRVSNCGNGEAYYFNSRTGESQLEEPLDIHS